MVEQKLRATLITGRTIDQGVGKEMGKGSIEYFDSASVCFMDKADMIKLGIRSGSNVQVTSKYGSVIVKALKIPLRHQPWISFYSMRFMGKCNLRRRNLRHGHAYVQGVPS